MRGLRWMVVLLSVAGGCGDEAAPGGLVTINVWRNDNASYKMATDVAFAEYTAAHPNVTIVATPQPWQAYTGALAAQLKQDMFAFDLVLMPPASVCTYARNLADVPAEVVLLSEAQNTFLPPPIEGSICAGVLKALPIEYNLEYGGVIVNLDKYQAKYPGKTPAWNDWGAFLAEASALSEYDASGKPCTNGLDIDPDWPEPVRHIFLSQILQRNGTYWAAGGTNLFDFATPQAREALTDMVAWVTRDRVLSPSLMPDKNTFVTQRLGHGATGFGCGDPMQPLSTMGYVGTWGLPASKAELPPGSTTRFDFFVLPPMVGTEHKFVQNAGFAFAVPKTSPNARIAWDIAKSLALSPTAMRKWAATAGTLPALKANATKEITASDPVLSRVQPLLDRGHWMGDIPYGATADVLGAMVTNYFAAVKGLKSIDQALADMQKQANESILMHR